MIPNGFRLTAAAACLVGLAAADARAAFVVTLDGAVTPEAGGFRYAYTLTNSSTAGEVVLGFAVTVPAAADVSAITSAAGFEAVYAPGDTTVEWVITPAGPGGLDNALPPGGSVAGFSFLSTFAPGTVGFAAAGDDGGSLVAADGLVAGPAAVPEPSGLALAAVAGAGYAGRRLRRPGSASAAGRGA